MLWIIILAAVVIVAAIVGLFIAKRNKGQRAPRHRRGGGRGHERNKIYVGNLNYRVRESDLKTYVFQLWSCS